MSKPRIALWYNVASGGSKRQVWYHTKGLLERGYSVTAFRPPVPQSDYLPIADLVEEVEIPLDRPPVTTKSFPWNLRDIATYQDRRLEAMDVHAKAFARAASKFDLVLANTCGDFHMPMVGRYLKGVPSVAYVNEPARYLYEAQGTNVWALPEKQAGDPLLRRLRTVSVDSIETRGRRLLVREERLSALAFDRILCNSYFSRESMLRAYGLDASVCYLGIDSDLFKVQGVEREAYVLGLSSILPPKNLELAIQAVSRSNQTKTLVWVYNVSDHGYLTRMQNLADDLGVSLVLKQLVTDDELVALLNRATCLIYVPHLEPFGFAPLEASSCGTPVVAIREGGVRETVMDGLNGLISDGDPQRLGDSIDRMFVDTEERERLGKQGAEWVRREWTLERATERLIAHIEELLRKS